jgi:hypothetical protein
MDGEPSRGLALSLSLALMIGGTAYILYAYYGPRVDYLIAFLVVYSYLVTLLVEKKLFLPKRIRRIYSNWWFERAALMFYIPGAYMLFTIGFNYGASFQFVRILMSAVFSALIGLFAVVLLHLLNIYMIWKYGG